MSGRPGGYPEDNFIDKKNKKTYHEQLHYSNSHFCIMENNFIF